MKEKESSIEIRRRKNVYTSFYITAAFVIVMAFFTFIGMLFPLRPSYSDTEKRELETFPKLTFASFWDGSFFDGVSTWFADTFPMRDYWITQNAKLKSLYGTTGEQIIGEVQQGDDIPDPAEPGTVTPVSSTPPAPVIPDNSADVDTQALGAIYIAGDSGYEIYTFNQSTAQRYSAAVNRIADQLAGKAKVYDMIVPTGIGVTLPDNLKDKVNSSDQQQAIAYMNSLLNQNVTPVEVMQPLLVHRNEYVYFRTDHHWTQLGAYYAYEQFAKTAGKVPVALSACTKTDYTGFLGSFYSDTGKNPALAQNPDVLETYLPAGNITMQVTPAKGDSYTWPVIYDVSDYTESLKYSAFIAGDNPYTVIQNSTVTDGSKCLLVKESFGNAFAPYLAANYQTVYVVDYRYYRNSITQLVAEQGIDTVLFINNISATRNSSLVSYLEAIS